MIVRINNNKTKIICSLKRIANLREKFRLRTPGAFFSPAFKRRQWDGYKYFITEGGLIETGLLPKFIEYFKKQEWEFELVDERETIEGVRLIESLGDIELRDYQLDASKATLNNVVEGLPFQRGILDNATNAGKTLIAVAIHKSYKKKKTLYLIHRVDIYDQSLKELSELLGFKIGTIQGKDINLNDKFTIGMVNTVFNNLEYLKGYLATVDIVFVDEGHRAASPMYQKILQYIYEASVRICLSGTPLKHKNKIKNMQIEAYFGPTLSVVSNKELVDKGHSTKPKIYFWPGNKDIKVPGDYDEEYRQAITLNDDRNEKIIKRLLDHIERGHTPILLVGVYHEHVETLFNLIPNHIKKDYKARYIHHKVKARKFLLDEFKAGKIELLVSSMVICEGHNIPLMKALMNGGGGDSEIRILQLLGRSLRKHESKEVVYYDDWYDEGFYLKRHSKHRIRYLKDQGFKVRIKGKKRTL